MSPTTCGLPRRYLFDITLPPIFAAVRQCEDDFRQHGIGQTNAREQRRFRRIEQATIIGRDAKAVVALSNSPENCFKPRL